VDARASRANGSQGGFAVSDRWRAGRAALGPPPTGFDGWRDKPGRGVGGGVRGRRSRVVLAPRGWR